MMHIKQPQLSGEKKVTQEAQGLGSTEWEKGQGRN